MLKQVFLGHFEPVLTEFSPFHTCMHQVVPFARSLEPYGGATWSWREGCRLEDTHVCVCVCVCVYYYTPLPLNLANKQASKQATSTSPFCFGHSSSPSLWALLSSSHPRA